MIDALRVAWQSLKDLWEEFTLLILMNIVWSLVALLALAPLLLLVGSDPILGLILSFVLFWLVPIVTSALCFVSNQVVHGIAISWATFAEGLRRYWLKGLIVTLISLVVLILIAINIQFYAVELQGAWTNFAVSLWVIVGIYWLVVQIYWFPMLLELKSEKVLVSLRNALALPFVSPGFSLTILLVLIIVTILCIVLTVPLVLFMAALLLLIVNRATRNRIEMIQRKREGQQGKDASKSR
jgi:uncharacterized membrane protein YesL